LRDDNDEPAILEQAERRRIALSSMSQHRFAPQPGAPILLLGYGQVALPAIRAGVHALADAVRAARTGSTALG
jgi:DNA-binding transcriptional MocR family regulator